MKYLLPFLLALPAHAQEAEGPNLAPGGRGKPGGVARLAAAQDLFALGLAGNDPVIALAAVRLAAEVELTEVERDLVTGPGAEVELEPGLASAPPGVPEMLTAARGLAGEDEAIGGLIDRMEAEVAQGPMTAANMSRSALAPGATDSWTVPFFGQSYAEVAVLGDGDTPLDIRVEDEGTNIICQESSGTDRLYCDFVPAVNGYFTVTVTNKGEAVNGYLLLTN